MENNAPQPLRMRSKGRAAQVAAYLKEKGYEPDSEYPVTVATSGPGTVRVRAEHRGCQDGRQAVAGVWDALRAYPEGMPRRDYTKSQDRADVFLVIPEKLSS